jgi:hypothetical protein
MFEFISEFFLTNSKEIFMVLLTTFIIFLSTGAKNICVDTFRKLFFKDHKFEINPGHVSISRFQAPGSKLSGNLGLALYSMSITNNTNHVMSIKSVELKYEFDGKSYRENSHVILTGSHFAPLTKTTENILLMGMGQNAILTIGWDNIRTEIDKNKILEPRAGVLKGSAYFVFNFSEADCLAKIKKIRLVITDSAGQHSIHKISSLNGYIAYTPGLELVNRNFLIDENGKVMVPEMK